MRRERPCVDARLPSCAVAGRIWDANSVGKWKKRRRRLSSYSLTLRNSPLVALCLHTLCVSRTGYIFFLLSSFFFLFQRRNTSHDFFPFSLSLSLSLLLRPTQMERAGTERNWTNRREKTVLGRSREVKFGRVEIEFVGKGSGEREGSCIITTRDK